jgi:hypothetical protein
MVFCDFKKYNILWFWGWVAGFCDVKKNHVPHQEAFDGTGKRRKGRRNWGIFGSNRKFWVKKRAELLYISKA